MSSASVFGLLIKSVARRNTISFSTFVLQKNISYISSNVNSASRYTFSRRCYSNLGLKMSKKGAGSSPQKNQTKITGFTKPKTSDSSRGISTGQSGTGGKAAPPKEGRGPGTTAAPVTRKKLEDEENKQVQKDREASLNMPLEEKRKRYKCGKRFVTLKDVETWKEEGKKDETAAATSPKKKKSSESKGKTYEAKDELNQKVSVWRGDITTLEIDAIVNAANESLLGGGGVDGAIHTAAGLKLKKECALLRGCSTGNAKITSGYDLPARYVIHTVGPIGEGEKDLRSCYLKSLERMRENKLTSIAFPCISTGIYGYRNEKAAPVAMKTVREWLEKEEYGAKVERVIFCLFLKVDVDLYNEGMKKFFPLVEEGPDENGAKNGKSDEGSEVKEDNESKMEVDTDDVKGAKACETKTSEDTAKPGNDIEMEEEKSGDDLPENPSNKMEEETEKKTEGSDPKSEDKVKAKKGDNPKVDKGDKGDNSESEKTVDSETDAKQCQNAKGDSENVKSSTAANEEKKPTEKTGSRL